MIYIKDLVVLPSGDRSNLLDEITAWTEYICPKCDTIIYNTGLGCKEKIEKHKKYHDKKK